MLLPTFITIIRDAHDAENVKLSLVLDLFYLSVLNKGFGVCYFCLWYTNAFLYNSYLIVILYVSFTGMFVVDVVSIFVVICYIKMSQTEHYF